MELAHSLGPVIAVSSGRVESSVGSLRATVLFSCYRNMSSRPKSEECVEMMLFNTSRYSGVVRSPFVFIFLRDTEMTKQH